MKSLIAVIFAFLPGFVLAAGGNVHLDDMKVDLEDSASLQRGAKYFTNYCMGCHSTKFARYNRVARNDGKLSIRRSQNWESDGDCDAPS
jgi:ubiquinol-cytochrome c reductase cytochrome c1 subunit